MKIKESRQAADELRGVVSRSERREFEKRARRHPAGTVGEKVMVVKYLTTCQTESRRFLEETFGVQVSPKLEEQITCFEDMLMDRYVALVKLFGEKELKSTRVLEGIKLAYGELVQELGVCDDPQAQGLARTAKKDNFGVKELADGEFTYGRRNPEAVDRYLQIETMQGRLRRGGPHDPDYVASILREIEGDSNGQNGIESYKASARKSLALISTYAEDSIRLDLDRFMSSFLRESAELTSEARTRMKTTKKDMLGWTRVDAFRMMCFAVMANRANHAHLLMERLEAFDTYTIGYKAMVCPYIIILEDYQLARLKRMAQTISSDAVATMVVKHSRWFGPDDPDLDLLDQVMVRLGETERKYGASVLPWIYYHTPGQTLAMMDAFDSNPDHVKLIGTLGRSYVEINADQYAEYVLEVSVQPIDENETFGSLLMGIHESTTPDLVKKIVRSSSDLYASGLALDICCFAIGDEEEKELAHAIINAIDKGEYEYATNLTQTRKQKREEEKKALMIESLRKEFGEIGESTAEEAIYSAWTRLGMLKFEGKCYFGSLRQRGLGMFVRVAQATDGLSDETLRVVFGSATNSRLFATLLERCGESGFVMDSTALDAALQDAHQDQRVRETIIEMELQRQLDAVGIIKTSRLPFQRLVLVCGERIANTLAPNLAEASGLKVISVDDTLNRKYIGSIVRPGDAVVVETSHIGHSASGTAIAVCKARGIPYVEGSQTNVGLIIERLMKAS